MSNAETKKFPLLEITTPETLTNCRNLSLERNNGTVFIASYPKSGTTWMQAIVYHLLSKNGQGFQHISDYAPFYENHRTWEAGHVKDKYLAAHASLGYSIFNTHLLPSMLPVPADSSPPMYCIYVLRRGKDVVTSFYHHLSHQLEDNGQPAYNGSFSSFLQEWCAGDLPFGRWLDHMRAWRGAALTHNVLFVTYEDMQHDILACIFRIAHFLRLPYANDEALMRSIAEEVSFAAMKRNIHQYQPISVQWKESFQFIRQGVIGDTALFTSELNKNFQQMVVDEYPEGAPEWLTSLVT